MRKQMFAIMEEMLKDRKPEKRYKITFSKN